MEDVELRSQSLHLDNGVKRKRWPGGCSRHGDRQSLAAVTGKTGGGPRDAPGLGHPHGRHGTVSADEPK